MIWKLKDLIQSCNEVTTEIDGEWVPMRPENYKCEYASLKDRLKAAWAVFTCKAEAFTWPKGQ